MVKCDKCGVETYMPFKCNYCGGFYCEQHRLPEFHECSGAFNAPRNKVIQYGSYTTSNQPGDYATSQTIRPYWFSKKELQDLAIGIAVILIIPIVRVWSILPKIPLEITGFLITLVLAFMLHELAHKFVAQRLGMWAEFRLSMIGLLLTLLSFILLQTSIFPLMIVAPGAVVIAGLMNWKEYGKISFAGPVTNIAQALIYLIAYYFIPNESVFKNITVYGMAVNSGLALFNLIPFGLFDGMKIFRWDWRAWLGAAIISGAIFFFVWF